ncbi:hypothetical protein GLOIN_2v1781359 [Rhizophagus clarus]|uniref:F-box domain-containing protein n=1 Tax=Rhizophagus clarus TaxID=94130 RepID=A0A8H3M7T2_9GLOM|nr:hypothetical protein GLOIN_2v1781359 [Rhizophagus clarus]
MTRLNVDCLNEIIEYLEDDEETLYSCLLVNHLWCVISVKILWRRIRNYYTLINCLPDESKKILIENGISITASKPLLFNYARFCKCISYHELNNNIEWLFKKQQSISIFQSSKNCIRQEIIKFLMSQITSLRKLNFPIEFSTENNMKTFITHFELINNLSELHCYSNIYPKFIYQLTQVCHTIQTLKITSATDHSDMSRDLISVVKEKFYIFRDLISTQKNLVYLSFEKFSYFECDYLIAKIPSTLIKFAFINGFGSSYIPLHTIHNLSNLQEFTFSSHKAHFFAKRDVWDEKLGCMSDFYRPEPLTDFLINNGSNLKIIYINKNNQHLNRIIRKYCKNARILNTDLTNIHSLELKYFFNDLPFLESIKINMCSLGEFNEKHLFELIVNESPKNFCELKLFYGDKIKSTLVPEELEIFLKSWENRIPQKSLSLVITGSNSFIKNNGNINVIEKYIKLGSIKLVNY